MPAALCGVYSYLVNFLTQKGKVSGQRQPAKATIRK